MAKTKRNIGQEILDGIRQIKRGQHGRITNVPSVASVREKTGLSQLKFATLAYRSGRCRSGSRGDVHPLGQPGLCCSLQRRIHAP